MSAPPPEHEPARRALRARDLGLLVGTLEPGAVNAITDVSGVRVGHTTILEPHGTYTGVTAVVPGELGPDRPLPAGLFVGNGYGKFVGATQVRELGEIETPILLTSTLSTFRAADALLTWVLRTSPRGIGSLNPVVGEINDSWLCGPGTRAVGPDHVWAALDGATGGPVPMGSVGGGTGACALGFKSGVGSSSRRVRIRGEAGTVGVLVQANMGGVLRLGGVQVTPEGLGLSHAGPATSEGSCVVVVAVDVPASARELERIAARGVFALGRVGAAFSHGSGDYGVALSTVREVNVAITPSELDELFRAVLDGVEEAVIDALLAATSVRTPSGRVAAALPPSVLRSGPG
ncbi:MAG: P1 family peptidase [Ornithinibacter sp.]